MPGVEKIRGHLEKKKDWIKRTRDYREKKDKIKQLKRKAKERNPDEFDFHMLRSQVGLDGVHRDFDSDEEDEEQSEVQRLLSDIDDIKYVRYHLGKEKKKIEKLKGILHFYAQDDPSGAPKNKHIIFVDNEEEASEFDLVKHFKTSEEFIGRTFNRPRLDQIGEGASSSQMDTEKLKASEKECRRLYAELGKRMERERELAVVLNKLELKRDLATSKKSELKPKLIQKGDSKRAAVYKWTYERKK